MEVERLQAVLEATGVASFAANMKAADALTDGLRDKLASLDASSKVASNALNKIKLTAAQAAETGASAEFFKAALRKIADQADIAATQVGHVKMTARQAVESKASAEAISSSLDQVSRNADQAKRKLEEVRLAGGRNGVGFGPIGSGFGRVGLLGSAVGAGVLSTPALGPAAIGLLASVPALAAGAAGALGTLALAFHGVGAAIGGNKKAYEDLQPAQQQFVLTVRSLDGWMEKLSQTASQAMFPGLTAALHDALSPGTVRAITVALQEFGSAIGQVGQMWGRYFGSGEFQQIFGPLMAAGAANLRVMSQAALSLFDALGRLGVAAAPFTAWLTASAAAGTRWLDTMIQAKQASGALGSALDAARSSLTLVGRLVEALGHAVGALGTALYPVSQTFLKDLVNGLNGLAAIIDRNQQGIRAFVNGALTAAVGAIRDLSHLVSTLSPAVKGLFDAVNALLKPFGGWKTVLEVIVAIKLASVVVGWAGAITKLGGSATAATAEVGGLRGALLSLGAPGVLAAIAAAAAGFAGFKLGEKLAGNPNGGYGTAAANFAAAGAAGQWVNAQGKLMNPAAAAAAAARAGVPWGLTAGAAGTTWPSNAAGSASGLASAGTRSASLSGGKQKLLDLAETAIGTPYLWGGAGPGGFDCSGLVMWAFANGLNIQLPRTTYGQAQVGTLVGKNTLKGATPGDVIFTQYGEGGNPGPGHEGIYVGGGQVLSAPHTGASVGVTSLAAFTSGGAYTVRNLAPGVMSAGPGAGGGASPPGAAAFGTGSPFGTPPPFKPTAAESSAAKAAAALKQQLATLRASLKTDSTQITTDMRQNLLPPAVAAELQQRALAINTALQGAGKNALPGIRTSLSQLKAAISEGLSQQAIDSKLRGVGKTLQDDLDNKLITEQQFTHLGELVGRYNSELTTGLLSPAERRKVEQNIANLKAALKLDVSLDGAQKQLRGEVAQLNAAVKAGLFPASLAATAREEAAKIGARIAEGTQAGLAAAKTAMKQLAATIKEGVQDATAIENYQQALATFGAGLEAKLNQLLGIPTTYASPAALATAEKAAASIENALKKGLTSSAYTAALAALNQQKKTIEDALNGMEQAVELAKSSYESAWSRLATAGDTAFDQATQDTVAKMQNDLQAKLAAMQVTVSTASGSFQYGGGITQTPAEAALAALQDQQTQAQLQQAVLDARTNLASAQNASTVYDESTGKTTVNANAQAVLDAQQQLADAQLAVQEDALQKQATVERAAADKTLQDQQTAAQQKGNAAITAYQQQRDLQKQALDDQVADVETAFEQGKIDSATAFGELTDLYKQNGIDIATLSVTIAGAIYAGVASWTAPIMGLMDDLQAKIVQVQQGQASLPGDYVPPPTSPGADVQAQTAAAIMAQQLAGNINGIPINNYGKGGGYGKAGAPQLHAAGGAFVTRGSTMLTPHDVAGESGQELVEITPLNRLGGDEVAEIHVHNYMDGQQVSEIVYRHLLKKKRRTGGLGLN